MEYKKPTYEDFYDKVIRLNYTNEKLCKYYNVSKIVILRWKRIYNMWKTKEQIVKSYKVWNKGTHKATGEGCKKGWFSSEKLFEKAKDSIGKPRIDNKRSWLVCLTEKKIDKFNKRNGKTYKHRKTEGFARYVLEKSGIEIPKGYVVYHKDGNFKNNDIGNLEIISRAELLKRNNCR